MDGTSPPPRTSGPCTLVVDDDAFVRKVLLEQLRLLGIENVATAADGREATALLRDSGPFNLILFDLVMPGFDGIELMREVATHQPNAAIVLSSSADPRVLRTAGQLAELRQLKVLGTLPKPVRIRDLQALLKDQDRLRLEPPPPRPAFAAMTLEDLRAALAQRQIEIFVQPIIELKTLRLHGVEALARCSNPAWRGASPQQFVALAERHGLIRELTRQVVRRSLEACAAWRRQGLEPHISVNLSPWCLDQLNLPDDIAALADEYALSPQRLSMEITESGLADDTARSLDILTRLRLRGVEVSIDDFGTGYSSLQQLQRIPFSQLKIDRSFVSRALDNPDARHIVEANVRLAHDLRLRAVAEGVETLGQLELLKKIGCDLGQGYLFARPMPAPDLPAWARRHAERSARGDAGFS